jgi:hypothetical protein
MVQKPTRNYFIKIFLDISLQYENSTVEILWQVQVSFKNHLHITWKVTQP